MKSTFTLALSFLLAGSILPAQAANNGKSLPGTRLVHTTGKHSPLPSYIAFEQGKEIDLYSWQSYISQNLGLDPSYGFTLLRTEADKLGHQHYRYQQTLNGIPFEHGIWIVHTRAGKVYSMNGLLYAKQNPITPALDETSARNKALAHVGAQQYKWEMPAEEAHLKEETGDPNATYFPHGTQTYIVKNNTIYLCWKFNVYAQKPLSRSYIYVDASTGEIVFTNKIIHHADAVGTAVTAYSGTQTITTDFTGTTYRLRETGRGNGIITRNCQTGTSYGAAVDFTDSDNFWNNVNPQKDEVATDAHFGAEMTYDYYLNIHGRNSINNAGFALNSYVHYDEDFANAFWDGNRMTYGDGDGPMGPLTALDIAGHEITHGLTSFTADLVYQDESGALNESFSDIFGVSIEFHSTPGLADWLMGEDIGVTIRSMSNPNAFGDPDTYFGTNWAPLGGPDNGGVHTNSGVQNYWYYLLVNGGTGTNDNGDAYSVSGIGLASAEAIAFRNLTVYLTPNSDYAEARFFAIQSAIDLFGACTPEVAAVTNAWYAVGVGPAYVAAVISDFNAPVTAACSAPFIVNFNNTSNNATTFSWNFGDGFTSSAVNPTHTYTAIGTYTVQLIADGGSCGKDTLVLTNYITIDTSMACEVNMPTSGIGATQTACSGMLYDSGGPTGNYGANEDAQITIAPIGAVTVDLDFTYFNVEPGTGSSCGYDNLTVYDGPNTSSPVIGVYCNNNIPTTVSSTGSSITLKFHSDPGLELAGYAVNWNCNLSTVAPTANFSANTLSTCSGTINFTDMSTNGPTGWSWDFGDGSTSALQHPSHTYTASGTYTVTLTASNGIGSDVHTQINYITVTLPDPPTDAMGPGVTVCAGNATTLTATSAGGTLTWYNVPTGGTPLGTGSPFVTPILGASTTFYVADETPAPSQYVGPVDNTFGAGGYFTGAASHYEKFTALQPFKLVSVKVYSNLAANRTIQLRNSSGVILQSTTVNIGTGMQIVPLNFDVPAGTDLQLGIQGNGGNMYRNSAGAVYPYSIPGLVSITNSSAGTPGYYYFFYNWEIQQLPCSSVRVPVAVSVQPCTDVNELSPVIDVMVVPNPATEMAKVVVKGADGKTMNMEIRNSIGQLVYSQSAQAGNEPVLINVSHFGRGVYFVNLVVEGERVVKKLVVE